MTAQFWLLLWIFAAIQQRGLPSAPAPTGTPPAGRSVIAGKVIQSGSKTPIAGAVITLRPAGISTTTNGVGEFSLNVPAGRHTLIVERDGFILQPDPPRAITEMGMPVNIKSGEPRDDIILPMVASPAISGHAYVPNGDPLAAAAVQAYRWRYTPFGPRLRVAKTVLTDDSGEFRLFRLDFADYAVSVSYNRRAQRAALGNVRLSPNVPDPDDGYATTFYGGATTASAAQRVRLAPGFDPNGINIVVSDVRRFRIQGRVVSPSATLPSDLKVVFVPEGNDLALDDTGHFVGTDANGNFDIRSVSPGSYVMMAFGGQLASDLVPVEVANNDIEKLAIPLAPTNDVRGRVSGSVNASGVTLSLVRTTRQIDLKLNAQVRTDGFLTLFNVGPGEYDVFAQGLPFGSYIRTVRYQGRDVLTTGLRPVIDPNALLEVTVSSTTALVEGRITDRFGDPAPGVQIVLVPEILYRRRPDRYIVGSTDITGAFQIRDAPPGRYTAFAFERIEPGAYYAFAYDPAVETRFGNRGERVNVTEGKITTVELKLIPAAETAGGL